LRLAALAALVLAGDRLIAGLLDFALPYSQFRFSRALRGGERAEVLIIGDSRPVSLYAPEIERRVGVSVFNLSYNGMSTLITEPMLREYLARNQKPKLIVYEVTNVQALQVLLEGILCYARLSPELGALADERLPRNRRAARLFHLFAYNSELPLRALYYARRSDQDWINRYHVPDALVESAKAMPDFELQTLPENMAALGRVTRLVHENGVELRLLILPYLPEYVAHVTNWDAWVEGIRQAAGPDERIWDYGRALHDHSLFADRLHLNEAGGVSFTARLAEDGFFAFDGAAPPQ
jgi:hypothetical protein